MDIGAQPDRFAATEVGDDIQGKVVTSNVALRARLQKQSLLAQFAREIGDARGAKR